MNKINIPSEHMYSQLSVSDQYRNMYVVRRLKNTDSLPKASRSDLFGSVGVEDEQTVDIRDTGNSDVNTAIDCIENVVNDCCNTVLPTNTTEGDRVGALSAAGLRGPWINGRVGLERVALAVDTFCPRNLLAQAVAESLQLVVEGNSGEMYGVGNGLVRLVGSATVPLTIGQTTRTVSFEISPDISDFAFFGLPEQERWGFMADHDRRRINFAGDVVPYYVTKEEAGHDRSFLAPVRETETAPKVVLEETIVVPPSSGGEGFLTRGKVKGTKIEGDVVFEPTGLKERYGMTGPRIIQRMDADGRVSVIVGNPFPVAIKLFRGAHVGHIFEAQVEEETAPKVMGDDESTSPDSHPLDRIDLSNEGRGPGWTAARQEKVKEMLRRRYKAFSRGDHDVGHTSWQEFRIDLKPECPGPVADAQRGYPRHKKEIIDGVVKDLLEKDHIELAQSSWRAFPVLAAKKDPVSREWIPNKRFAIDYRGLNAWTIKWNRLIPKVSEVVDSMNGATWFSSIDLISGYHQIPIAPESRPMTAFCVPGGRQFQWKVMPFGLANAGACFSQLMEMVLAGLSYKSALAYLDDIIVWSNSFDQHVEDVEMVLERLELAGLKARTDKTHLFVKKVDVLGHVVSADGVRPDPMKTKAVEKWPKPENAKELVSFLAFCNFYRRFVKGFAAMAHPLNQLTHQDVTWSWKKQHQEAFDALKRALCSEPVMALPDFTKEFVIDSDWSRKGLAWVLQQQQEDGKLHPILYGSRGLTRSEQKYGSTRGEFLALSEGIISCRHYLLGAKFTARTDNKALVYLKNYRDLTHRTARALEVLSDFGDFTIQYVAGKKNIPADSLSRIPWKETSFAQVDANEILAPVTTRSAKTDAAGASKEAHQEPEGPLDWVKAQSKDSDVKLLKTWLKDGARPSQRETSAFSPALKSYWASFAQFRLKEGVVYRIWTDALDGPDQWLKVVPQQWQHKLLEGYHDGLGHPGVSRLNATLRNKYYWNQMSLDARRHVETCPLCQVVKPNRVRAPLQQHPLSFFNERVFFDLKGPLSATRRGNQYFLVLVDGFSKWTEIVPLPDVKAATVFQALYQQWVCRNGCPVSLHSDRGSSLTGKLAQEVVDLLNIEQTTTVSHHQMGNGQAETKVKASIAVISSILKAEDTLEWDLACAKTSLALNTVVNSTTGQTPWLVKHSQGEEVILPVDVAVGNTPDEKEVGVAVRGLRNTQRRIYEQVMEATGSSLRRQKRNYDRLVAGPEIKVGDLVRYENHQADDLDKSFKPKFRDVLYRVVERLGDVNLRIESVDADKVDKRVVHYNQLKLVDQPRSVLRPQRNAGMPARFEDYDLDDGAPKVR